MRALLVVVVLSALVSVVEAAPLAPSKPSQLGQLTSNLVGCTAAGSRQLNQLTKSDGSTVPFVIPPKQVFVVTAAEISFQLVTAGHRLEVSLYREGPSGEFGQISLADVVSDGAPRVSLAIPHGAAVKSGTKICVIAIDFNDATKPLPTMVVHGFFAKDN